MTDQELAQEVSDRINAAEAAAADNPKRLRQLKRAHALLQRAEAILLVTGDISVQSGGQKPPQVP